jgi:TolB-like protein/Flp pilus assembly protein TadD
MLGRQIGHYRLLEQLGAGGMGEVYRAEDYRLHRLVALKILSPEHADQPRSVQRFRREARSVAALNHPNIVTVHSVEESDGLHFLTMELVEGKTLTERIPPDGLPLRELLDIALPLADALAAAHAQGIVHRDLKPDNVMVGRDGRVKILDFGIAKGPLDHRTTLNDGETAETLIGLGPAAGTPHYMAPEQILHDPVDPRTDLFAFGIILYQMATGRHPFRRRRSGETFASILRDTPPPPSHLNPRVPAELDALVASCLEKDVARRIPSAAALRARLHALSAGRSAARRPWWRRPGPLVALAACLVFVWSAAWSVGWTHRARIQEILASPLSATVAEHGGELPRLGLAVLPLGNYSHDPEYFVDGMTDCLISALADVRGVRVISRQSVMRFKGSTEPLPRIAGELGVQLIVQGSVLRDGDRVRITTQLVRVDPEQQIWTQSYERDLKDILTLQNEVAAAIAQAIKVELEPGDRRRLAASRLVDPAAYDAYLRGRHARNKRTDEGILQAMGSFQEAVDRDPGFALAHAALAEAQAWAGSRETRPPAETYRQARRHAQTALEIAPDLADAHVALSFVQLMADRDWRGSEASIRRALALQPNHPTAHQFYWFYLHLQGRRQEAEEQIRIAAELDPLSVPITLNLGVAACLAGKDDEALRLWQKVEILDPKQSTTQLYLSVFYLQKGDQELSYRSFREFLARRYAEITPQVDRAHRGGGRQAALEAAAQALEGLARQRPLPPDDLAQAYLLLGRRDKAVDWLERVYERGSPLALVFRASWTLQSLRSEPRFQALLQKIG